VSQRSVIRQQLKLKKKYIYIYIYIENSVMQACEIFGHLSTKSIIEVNPSLTVYVACIIHKCIGSRTSNILCKETAWILLLSYLDTCLEVCLLKPSGSTGYSRGKTHSYVLCTTGMTSEITTIWTSDYYQGEDIGFSMLHWFSLDGKLGLSVINSIPQNLLLQTYKSIIVINRVQ